MEEYIQVVLIASLTLVCDKHNQVKAGTVIKEKHTIGRKNHLIMFTCMVETIQVIKMDLGYQISETT